MKVRFRTHPLTADDRAKIARGARDPRGHSKSTNQGSDAIKFRTSPSQPAEGGIPVKPQTLVYNSSGEPLYAPEQYGMDTKRVFAEGERAAIVMYCDKPVMQPRRPEKAKRQSAGWSEKTGGWVKRKR